MLVPRPLTNSVDQIDGPVDVRMRHVQRIVDILVEKRMTEPPSGVRQQGRHWTSILLDGVQQAVYAFLGRKVALDGKAADAGFRQLVGRILDEGLIGGN